MAQSCPVSLSLQARTHHPGPGLFSETLEVLKVSWCIHLLAPCQALGLLQSPGAILVCG